MANEHSNPSQRVVITGLGVVSPIGSDLDSLWKSLEENRTGISPLESLPTAALPVKSGAEVKDFSGAISDYGELEKPLQRAIKKNMKVMCREIEMGVAAAQKAIQHSRLDGQRDPQRCGCLFGCDYILSRPEEYADGLRACHKASGDSASRIGQSTVWGRLILCGCSNICPTCPTVTFRFTTIFEAPTTP